MKYISIILAILFLNVSIAQGKYLTKTGTIDFEASVPSFEEVKAQSSSATAIINTDNGDFASLVLMKSFRFKVALMEEHFNENYAESDTYTKAILRGKIENFDINLISSTGNKFKIKGNLTMHGVTKELETYVLIKKEDDTLNLISKFRVKPENFNIKIPKIVRNKVSEHVDVLVNFKLKKKN